LREAGGVDALIVGAGGLGGPLVYALGAAGWRLRVCDDDVVDLSNLQRQVQFITADVGRPKADALADEARRRGIALEAVRARFDASTAAALAGDARVLIDGSDDPATKLAVGDWAVAHGRLHVIAGVLRWGGTVFAGAPGRACFRCLFEDAPGEGEAPSCADAGVVGAACAVIGGLAAEVAIALASGDTAGAGSILVVDDLRTAAWPPRRVRFERRPGCSACAQAPGIAEPDPS
jgi:molybdopterin/thiamine biosynthesis adenylyltransferase